MCRVRPWKVWTTARRGRGGNEKKRQRASCRFFHGDGCPCLLLRPGGSQLDDAFLAAERAADHRPGLFFLDVASLNNDVLVVDGLPGVREVLRLEVVFVQLGYGWHAFLCAENEQDRLFAVFHFGMRGANFGDLREREIGWEIFRPLLFRGRLGSSVAGSLLGRLLRSLLCWLLR